MKRHRLYPYLIVVCVLLPGVVMSLGCSYQCHTYEYVDPVADDGRWKVVGELTRAKPADRANHPGSFPHWAPNPEDRYTLVLVPVSSDPDYWLHGCVDIRNVRVIAGDEPVGVKLSDPDERRFVSLPFHIPVAPDVLPIEFDLVLLDAESDSTTSVVHVVSQAVADRHRRWHIVDMMES